MVISSSSALVEWLRGFYLHGGQKCENFLGSLYYDHIEQKKDWLQKF